MDDERHQPQRPHHQGLGLHKHRHHIHRQGETPLIIHDQQNGGSQQQGGDAVHLAPGAASKVGQGIESVQQGKPAGGLIARSLAGNEINQRDNAKIAKNGRQFHRHHTRAGAKKPSNQAQGPEHQHIAGGIIAEDIADVEVGRANACHLVRPSGETGDVHREASHYPCHHQAGKAGKKQDDDQVAGQPRLSFLFKGDLVSLGHFGEPIKHRRTKGHHRHQPGRRRRRGRRLSRRGRAVRLFPRGDISILRCFRDRHQGEAVKGRHAAGFPGIAPQPGKHGELFLCGTCFAVKCDLLPLISSIIKGFGEHIDILNGQVGPQSPFGQSLHTACQAVSGVGQHIHCLVKAGIIGLVADNLGGIAFGTLSHLKLCYPLEPDIGIRKPVFGQAFRADTLKTSVFEQLHTGFGFLPRISEKKPNSRQNGQDDQGENQCFLLHGQPFKSDARYPGKTIPRHV